jgi:integrase/recombinase XerC
VARAANPWFWDDRNAWYVVKDGRRHHLGDHPTDAPPPRKKKGKWVVPPAIRDRYHELMSAKPARVKPAPVTGLSVAEVFEKFLDWCQRHRSARSFEWYRTHIQDFTDFLSDPAGMPVTAVKPFHLIEWADSHATWGDSHRRGALIAVQRPFNWAAKLGYIDASPVWRRVEKPEVKRRENPMTPDDFSALLGQVKDQPFRDLIAFLWETGCRPQEARHIEARHVHLSLNRIEIPAAEAKGKKRRRIIFLSAAAAAIVTRVAAANPEGKLFRNVDGNPWTVDAVNCRFGRLKAKLGRRFAAYDLRHGFVDRKLDEGVDLLTIAGLLGHRDASMLIKHYEHRSRDHSHLLNAVHRPAAESSGA